MASAGRFFFAGMASSILLIGAGFVGGTMLAQRAVEPAFSASTPATAADLLPPARVILPSMTEAAAAPGPTPPAEAVPSTPPQEQMQPQPAVAKEDSIQQPSIEKKKQVDLDKRVEKRRAEAEHDRHRRYAERKAKRDAARAKQQREQLQQQQQLQEATRQPIERTGIMAFDAQEEPKWDGFFGH